LGGVTAILDAGKRRKESLHGSMLLSLVANVGGVFWAARGTVGVGRASRLLYGTALGALGFSWLRLRGGQRSRSLLSGMIEPRPEKWARRDVDSVLAALGSHDDGLTSAEAAGRTPAGALAVPKRRLLSAVWEELRSPLIGVLAAGAALSLVMGAVGDVAIIGATIAANVAVGLWQERKAGKVAESLRQMGVSYAHVLRDGRPVMIPATRVVPGDMLLLAPGERIAADARVVSAQGLEVDEAALTGESFPVMKVAEGGAESSQIVLEGTDVTTGTGRAVVVAVGRQTRMGATAAALSVEESEASPLGKRLGQVLRLVLPLAAAGGLAVFGAGLLRGGGLLPQATLGATVALAAVPEGLPLLAGVSEAVTARRLANRSALVRRVSAVEALGRVDVVCTDKTGTITEGRLTVRLLATAERDAKTPGALSKAMREVLLTAALACPHPDNGAAGAHPTDVAVVRAAEEAGMGASLRVQRFAEASFDPVRAFQADIANGALCVKGAPEAIAARCVFVRRRGADRPLDDEQRSILLERARTLAARGLRVLMVARGEPAQNVEDPRDLTALGFIGIADPLKPGVIQTVRRCQEAGVRVVMLTGDHPATARAIAEEAGLLGTGREVLTGADLAELQNGELDARIERAAVIARATPLDKLRIIESLRRGGHTVAMTGDGVNDAPALRLADVGVAMGRGGTEVARQTADVVLSDDNFATLVDTFVEGRSFWRNIRRSMSLLLGGNLGELGLVVGATALAAEAPLTVSQILAVNLITDVLPSLSVALQRPEHNNLAGLAREGTTALDTALRRDVLRRGLLTAGPSLAAYLIALRSGTLGQARGVAFGSIIATQLAQTLDAGWAEGSLTPSVLTAVAGSASVLLAALTVPPIRDFLTLGTPTLLGWGLIGGGALLAMALSHGLASRTSRPAPATVAMTTASEPRLRLLPANGR
ncbi:MAG TPA: cation-transporting P-type ATPase, partial [Ktedonobacterales bacterium]|nr:cation-transporting P-type ATPase [Ktedonobacterales bacterium]